jgi:uncharacterized protein YjbI with pentapeptide repeats
MITITRKQLTDLDACADGLAYFDTIAPDGTLAFKWTPLAQAWLAVDAGKWVRWAREHNILPYADLSGADLSGADLSYAILRDAVLSGANLRGADLNACVPWGITP